MAIPIEILQQYNLPACSLQRSFGNERPCCAYAWNLVQNSSARGQQYASSALQAVPLGLPRTACVPKRFGVVCREARDDE